MASANSWRQLQVCRTLFYAFSQWIFRLQRLHGSDATIMPLKVASDKTLLAAQKGNAEFYPIYVLPGNIDEDLEFHSSVVTSLIQPHIYLTTIVGATDAEKRTEEYRIFARAFITQAFQVALSEPLQELEEAGIFTRCPDGYYRCFFPQIVAHLADDMEKTFLALPYVGWCERCLIDPSDKGKDGQWPLRHEKQRREALATGWPEAQLKQAGLRPLLPYTDNLRLTDMHSILVSDILHQLLKGIFLHHIVQWVLRLIELEHQERPGPGISELERRLKFMPAFPGIRTFYTGLNFSRWSAGDAEQLAAIFAPAIYGLIPTPAMRCTVALLEFIYFAKLPVFGAIEREGLQQAKTRFFADLPALLVSVLVKTGKIKGLTTFQRFIRCIITTLTLPMMDR
ncbi:hypothetical protein BT69DRAFT_1213335 [Atractiella rhizophila]|nr:hypothetical protein BT69DRAFT_1213335 [Atractiella rhizophila]